MDVDAEERRPVSMVAVVDCDALQSRVGFTLLVAARTLSQLIDQLHEGEGL